MRRSSASWLEAFSLHAWTGSKRNRPFTLIDERPGTVWEFKPPGRCRSRRRKARLRAGPAGLSEFLCAHRLGEDIALHQIEAHFAHGKKISPGLNALGHGACSMPRTRRHRHPAWDRSPRLSGSDRWRPALPATFGLRDQVREWRPCCGCERFRNKEALWLRRGTFCYD